MNGPKESDPVMKEKPLRIIKEFKAPRELVFNAFLDPEILKQWWGPEGFTCPFFETDPKVGGKYFGCMKAPDGKDNWSTGHYVEIKNPEKLKYTDCFADKNGKVVPATYYGLSKNFPLECVVDLLFTEKSGTTTLELNHYGIPKDEFENCTTGWSECLVKLANAVEDSAEAKKTKATESRSPASQANRSV